MIISSLVNGTSTLYGLSDILNYIKDSDITEEFLNLKKYVETTKTKKIRKNCKIKENQFQVSYYQEENAYFIGSDLLNDELTLLKLYEYELKTQDQAQTLQDDYNQLKIFIERFLLIDVEFIAHDIEYSIISSDLDDLMLVHKNHPTIDEQTFKLVDELSLHLQNHKTTFFEKITDFGLGLTANFAILRVHLLKFLAILTGLEHDQAGVEVKRILQESFHRTLKDHKKSVKNKSKGQHRALPPYLFNLIWIALKILPFIPAQILAAAIRNGVKQTARRFIAGVNIHEAINTINALEMTNRDATLDQLGELVVSEKEADQYMNKVLELIYGLEVKYPKLVFNSAGIPRAHISIKVSALASDFKPYALEYVKLKLLPRLEKILLEAQKRNIFVNIDAEHYHIRNAVLKIWGDLITSHPTLKTYPHMGIVIQAYLKDSHLHFQDVLHIAQKRNIMMPIRLVKGAYWDAETIESIAHNFEAPQFLNKEETDIRFRQLILKTFKHGQHLQLAVASHNIHDHCWAEIAREKLYPQAKPIEHQCLHMTYEALSIGLAKMQWAVRNYVPVGDLLVGMAYLVRRIMENSSQVGILTIMRSHKKLERYTGPLDAYNHKKSKQLLSHELKDINLTSRFTPVSAVRIYFDYEYQQICHSLDRLKTNIPWIKQAGGVSIKANHDQQLELGTIQFFSRQQVEFIIDQMAQDWKVHPFLNNNIQRCSVMLSAARLMKYERIDIANRILLEAGKTITEALADVDEAIDFINFYVREHIHNIQKHTIVGRGVTGVIAPWNFPIAIPCGMMVAPLIAGNPVVLKSSEKSPLIADYLVELFYRAGTPSEVLKHVPGLGSEVGEGIINHDKIATIVFTGSLKIGVHLTQVAQKKLVEWKKDIFIQKKIITEMGGKNAILVTNNCELDETVSGIMYSAYAHAGQKCSACSRVIIHNQIKDKFIERFVEASRDIAVGPAINFSTYINPIIGRADRDKILRDVELIKEEVRLHNGKIHLDRTNLNDGSLNVGPLIVELPATAVVQKESMAQKEFFAPIVHVIGYSTLEEAIAIFNSVDYALTGGIYCQSQDDIDYLLKHLDAGNLYVNRPNTGARVAIEPFGGYKLSGTGPKAGGRDYLKSFYFKQKPHFATNGSNSNYELAIGSDYMFRTPRPNQQSIDIRLMKVNSFIERFMKRYDLMMKAASEENKIELKRFRNFLLNELKDYLHEQSPNHYIPGQLNYNDRTKMKATILIIGYFKPNMLLLKQFLTALALGRGIIICCRTQEAFDFWYELYQILLNEGFSRANIEVVLANTNVVHNAIHTPAIEMQFTDAPKELLEKVLDESSVAGNFSHYMRSLHSPFEYQSDDDYRELVNQFINVRAIAINTMRHGAPLELEPMVNPI
jgi:RHH-type proline utilization regulon transcriptional repressor/proline dehydrogenase/delta 1-pyrroline-5-carboxylate dehydrogenase